MPSYQHYGAPWKRGVLLVGPPGNGKTMCIKALANSLRVDRPSPEPQPTDQNDQRSQPKHHEQGANTLSPPLALSPDQGGYPIDCLYVRSLVQRDVPDHYTIGQIFAEARRKAPCLLIVEDLDAQVTDQNRSIFLNELDGFAQNDGLIIIATSNHSDRLDPALRVRPSRFDLRWTFQLPALPERQRYLQHWNQRLEPERQISDHALQAVATDAEGFSFAYLKELCLSAAVRWVQALDEAAQPDMASILVEQLARLRKQLHDVGADAAG